MGWAGALAKFISSSSWNCSLVFPAAAAANGWRHASLRQMDEQCVK